MQAYFPLTEKPGFPAERELDLAWSRWLNELAAFSRNKDRSVVFCELGYARSANAALRPWESREGDAHADAIQQRCLKSVLTMLNNDEQVVGAFLWKWFAGPTTHESFLMSTPAMRRIIAHHWGDPGAEPDD